MRATLMVGGLALGGRRRATADVENTAIIMIMDGVRVEESRCDSPTSATGEAPWEILPETWASLVPQGARATSALNYRRERRRQLIEVRSSNSTPREK